MNPFALAAELVTGTALELVKATAFADGGGGKVDIQAEVVLDLDKFGKLKNKAKRAVIIGANRAAKPVRAAVEANALAIARRGFTAKSVGTKTRFYAGAKSVVTIIGPKMSFTRSAGKFTRGPRKGETKKAIPYLYAWLIEKGTVRSKARPFLGPALDARGPAYRAAVVAEVGAELAKALG